MPRRATELADGKTGTSADNRTCDSRSADFSVVFRPGQNAADAFHRWQRVLPQLRHQHVKFLQPSPNPLNRGLLAVTDMKLRTRLTVSGLVISPYGRPIC